MKKLLTLPLFALLILTAHAQNRNPLVAIQVQLSRVDTTVRFPDYGDTTTLYNAHLKLYLTDTTGISKIHVTLKKSKESSSILETTFDYDVRGALAGGYTYDRNKRIIDIGLGEIPGIFHVYAEARLEKSNGQLMPAVVYSR